MLNRQRARLSVGHKRLIPIYGAVIHYRYLRREGIAKGDSIREAFESEILMDSIYAIIIILFLLVLGIITVPM